MDQKMLFVYNPRAGKAQIRSNLLDIIDIFVKAGYEVTAYPTQAAGDAIKAVKARHEGYDIVVCSGGDGTLDEVVSGMMQCEEKLPIGYIPAGSTNDFANSLKIPKSMINTQYCSYIIHHPLNITSVIIIAYCKNNVYNYLCRL